ncbi:hypothetical protein RR46_11832 [Papilio xuthus]|uniref:Uncharacterized protein n=1 Tax=Papilio xuthus TaxID=66420 RepID=A0A194PPC3_PAPXU|nr:hypothetical protein RR46_11832 [Papilio xuthus]
MRRWQIRIYLRLLPWRPWGAEARGLFKEISARLIDASGDPRAGAHFGQRLSLAIQRGNAASLLGTLPCDRSDLGSIFYII